MARIEKDSSLKSRMIGAECKDRVNAADWSVRTIEKLALNSLGKLRVMSSRDHFPPSIWNATI